MPYTIDTPINKFRPEILPALLAKAVQVLKPTSPLLSPTLMEAFYKAGQQYGIDQVYLLAHAILESAWGTSDFAVQRNNLFGYQAYDSDPNQAKTFPTKEDCVWFIAKFVSTQYLTPTGKWYGGSPTLRGMNKYYATAQHWGAAIANLATQLEAAMNLSAAVVTPTATTQRLPLDFYSVQRLITIIADKGANVRTYPSTKESNIVAAVGKNTNLPMVGYVVGENVNGNSLWWKLEEKTPSGEPLYVWSGATNVLPGAGLAKAETIEATAAPQNPVTPLPSPETLQLNLTELQAKVESLEKINKGLVENMKIKDTAYLEAEIRIGEKVARITQLEQDLQNAQTIKDLNQHLSGEQQAYKTKIAQLKDERDLAMVKAFENWELFQINAGFVNLIKTPLFIIRLVSLIVSALRNDYVVGWKKGAKIYKYEPVNLPTI